MQDLGALLSAEQQRLLELIADRRNLFLKQATVKAREVLGERLHSLHHPHNRPEFRREINHLGQEIAREQLAP